MPANQGNVKYNNIVGVFVYKADTGETCLGEGGRPPILVGYVNVMAEPIRMFIKEAVKDLKGIEFG